MKIAIRKFSCLQPLQDPKWVFSPQLPSLLMIRVFFFACFSLFVGKREKLRVFKHQEKKKADDLRGIIFLLFHSSPGGRAAS
jgi:Mg2+/citrate symporter